MANTTIRLRKSGVTSNVPVSLELGELALNYADGKLYYKNASGAITYISGGATTNSFATINSNSSLILATSNTDILTLVGSNNITISTDTINKKITIGSSLTNSLSNNQILTGLQTVSSTANITFDYIATANNGQGYNFKVGDDAWIGDINLADTMSVRGQQNPANGYIVFGNSDGTKLGRTGAGPLTYGGGFGATYVQFGDGTKQYTANAGSAGSADTVARSIAQAAYDQANVTIGVDATQNTRIGSIETINTNQNTTIGIIQGVDLTQNTRLDGIEGTNLTQNTNITTANNAAWAAFTKANNALANTTGTFAGDLTVTGNVTVSNIYGTAANTSIVAGNYTTTFDNAGKLTLPGMIVFADATTQNTAFTGNAIDSFARTTANGANGLAAGAYNQANVTIGVDTTQNTNIQAAWNAANAAFNLANTEALMGGWTANTVLVANAAGYLNNSNTYFVAANNTLITGNVIASNGTFNTIIGQTEVLKGTGTNLVNQSQTFTNVIWNKTTGVAVDNVTTAPDGTTTAGSFISNNATTGYLINAINSVSGLAYTFSVYLKPNSRTSWTLLAQGNMFSDAASRSAIFTLTGSGSVASTSGSGASATITSVGNGWYRCSLTFTTTLTITGSGVQIRDSATGDGTTGIYVWGAQLEIGSIANTYIPTTTTAVYGTPTLSFSGVAGLSLASNGSLYVSPAGTASTNVTSNLTVMSAASSTSNTTGALVVSGGLGVAGNVFASNVIFNGRDAQAVNDTQNTNITTANNAAWAAYAAGNTNATNITAVNTYAASAFTNANVAFVTANNAVANLGPIITVNSAGRLYVANTTTSALNVSGGAVIGTNFANYLQVSGNTTGLNPYLSAQGSDANIGIRYDAKGTSLHAFGANGNTSFAVYTNPTSVDYFQMTGSNIGFPVMQAAGASANIGLTVLTKGTGGIFFKTGTSEQQAQISATTGAVNYLNFTGAIATRSPTISVAGTDTDISLNLTSKAAGTINLNGVDVVGALSSNASLQSGINTTQNTNITTANNAAWAAYAAGNTNATNITSVNQYAVSAYAQANVTVGVDATQNTRLNSIETVDINQNTTIGIIQSVDVTQNTRLDGIEGTNLTQNTNITTANNAAWAAYAAGNTNATNITAVNQFAQSAYTKANNALANTGSLITVNGASQLYISNTTTSISNTTGALVVNGGLGVKGNVSTDGIIFADGTRQTTAASGTGGSSSSSLTSWTVINSNYTVGNNIQLLANSTGGTFTITLPASPVTSNVIVIADGCSPNTGWSNNNVLVNPNGRTIEGIADTLALNISQSSVSLIYDGATWQVISSTGPKGDTGSAGPAGATGNTGPAGIGSNATQRIYRFNATNNQTIFIGADAYSQTLSYNVNALDVYLNGVFLRPTEDYVANNGTTIYLTSGSYANDALDVVTFQNMSLTAAQNTITTYTYTASNNQTSFGGADVNGLSLNYNPNNLFVTLNGLTLRSGVDYLQSNTSYIALTSGALANDEISIVAFGSFSVQGQNTQNTISTYYYTSTAGQTNFTGSDIYGRTLSYMQDGLIVVRNGSTLRNRIDYSATNGTSVSLTNATAANDEIAITAFGNFSVAANGYTQVEANNLFLTKTDANNIFASTANTYTKAQANTAFASTGKAIAMAIVFGG